MPKKIFMEPSDVEGVVGEIRASLTGMRCYGSVSISRSFKKDDRFATLYFLPEAWVKMTSLVARYSTEVQWHGLVRRIDDNAFEIYDILVPPHEVTGTTVISDYAPYGKWLDALDDETFNAVKFHGHSHVNMCVSPSSVDTKYRLDLVTQLPQPVNGMDVFYIFLIINKRHEWSAEIYDLTNNALYSTDDINVEVVFEHGTTLEDFIQEATKVAVNRPVTQTYKNWQQGDYSYRGGYGLIQPHNTPATPIKKGKPAPKQSGGKCCGYDTWEEYWEAIREKDELCDCPEDEEYDKDGYVDEDDDPTSPFYVKEW